MFDDYGILFKNLLKFLGFGNKDNIFFCRVCGLS